MFNSQGKVEPVNGKESALHALALEPGYLLQLGYRKVGKHDPRQKGIDEEQKGIAQSRGEGGPDGLARVTKDTGEHRATARRCCCPRHLKRQRHDTTHGCEQSLASGVQSEDEEV